MIDNPLFPLARGSQWEYAVITADGSVDHLLVEVAAGDKIIMGVKTTSVEVTLSEDAEIEEWSRVVAEELTLDVSAGFFAPVTVIENWSEIDPLVVEQEHYAEGVGLVYIDSASAQADTVELLSFTIAGS